MQVLAMPSTGNYPGGRRKDPNYKQLNLNLSPDLIKKLRVKAVEGDFSMSELAEIIFQEWLEKNS